MLRLRVLGGGTGIHASLTARRQNGSMGRVLVLFCISIAFRVDDTFYYLASTVSCVFPCFVCSGAWLHGSPAFECNCYENIG